MKKIKQFLLIVLVSFTTLSESLLAQETITVEANTELETDLKIMQGFLHGGAYYLDSAKVAALNPQFWRIGAFWLVGSGYEETKKFNPEITVNINDLYMIVNGITTQILSKPWLDGWVKWDSLLTAIATNSIINEQPVDYWDVWGEPDNFWTGTYGQWIEMYRRTDSILSSILPDPKIIGPEFGFGSCDFNALAIADFLDSLYSAGSTVSGVSWHEFCDPSEVPIHVQQVRELLLLRPWLGTVKILIPEYAGPTNHIIPGWNVGWLYYFEKSGVDWVSHACWDETDGIESWSDCQYGLNGLFMKDNFTTQPNYWVHLAYSNLDSVRINTSSTHPKILALASKDNPNQELKIVVGRYDNPNLGMHNTPVNVGVNILDFPYCSSCTLPIIIQQIPSNNVAHSVPLNAPLTVYSGTLEFMDGEANVTLSNFVDGDAYIIYINPSPGSVLSAPENFPFNNTNFQLSPNPATDMLNISLRKSGATKFLIFNTLGEVVKTVFANGSVVVNVADMPSGLYFVQDASQPQHIQKFVKE